jgi:hypothetical protein
MNGCAWLIPWQITDTVSSAKDSVKASGASSRMALSARTEALL